MYKKAKSIVTCSCILKENCQHLAKKKANRDGALLCVKPTPII